MLHIIGTPLCQKLLIFQVSPYISYSISRKFNEFSVLWRTGTIFKHFQFLKLTLLNSRSFNHEWQLQDAVSSTSEESHSFHWSRFNGMLTELLSTTLSYDQLLAASPTGRNAVTWRSSLSNDQGIMVDRVSLQSTEGSHMTVYHYNDKRSRDFTKCKHKIYSTLFLFTWHTCYCKHLY